MRFAQVSVERVARGIKLNTFCSVGKQKVLSIHTHTHTPTLCVQWNSEPGGPAISHCLPAAGFPRFSFFLLPRPHAHTKTHAGDHYTENYAVFGPSFINTKMEA